MILFWTPVPYGEALNATITTSRGNTTAVSNTRSGHSNPNSRRTAASSQERLGPVASPTCSSWGLCFWRGWCVSWWRFTYFSCFVEGQICRRAFWSTSALDEVLKLSSIWILVCEPPLHSQEELITKQNAKQNPQSFVILQRRREETLLHGTVTEG